MRGQRVRARARGPLGGAAAPWTPLALGDALVLWLRADLGNTAPTNGVWLDQSGNGYHTNQGDATRRPTLTAGWKNGLPALNFDGSNDVLANVSGAILPDGSAYSLFVVGAKDVDPDTEYNDQFFRISGTAFHKLQLMRTGGTRYCAGSNAVDIQKSGAYTFGTLPFMASWVEGGTTTVAPPSLRINGVAQTAVGELNPLNTVVGYQVGGDSAVYFDGKIAEVILVAGALDAAGVAQVEEYILGTWGEF
jgi:hypothetical protein